MHDFKHLFGIDPDQVKEKCLITPFLTKNQLNDLSIVNDHKGLFYFAGQNEKFTLIRTRVGATMVGDAVLYLEETPCKEIIFLGACGVIPSEDRLDIGSLACPTEMINLESFSSFADGTLNQSISFQANAELSQKLCTINNTIKIVRGASCGSLKLEKDYIDKFKNFNIDVLDMECSAVYSAAAKIKRKATALMYITDIIGETSPFVLSEDANKKVAEAQQASTKILLELLS